MAELAGSTAATLVLLDIGLRWATGDAYLDIDQRLRNGPVAYEPNQRMRWKRSERE